MPFHMCEKRHRYVCPVNLEVTSKAPMNWLIAPVFASIGRVVTQSPSLTGRSIVYAAMPRFARHDKRRTGHASLTAHGGSGLHLAIAPNRRSHAGATWDPEALVEQTLFQRRQEQEHVWFLTAVAHQPYAPDFSLHRSESAGDFNVELIEQLIPYLRIVNATGNHHCRDRWQTIRRILHEQIQTHG